ncbi:sulfite exporter TauE/SafE family protein [Alkalihalobacillus pseudalcaliphilus]|uniref:sulfite exporter TauE/SafE family protein n=1 Tax=Alkalihalobacillus pseudalcaliphilus TaxID=79884 RepID=UPI00064E0D34|nr:sulfite exporter TauE/SafE family protein [Alkalihalobacillus pseudalcaliphilus]KMK76307.1 membrane protein [Alkalihalobacillus pseudalcaliphilus]
MDILFIITIFLIGFLGSFISGMVGVGGSIIKYPMLLFIPPLLGFAAFTAHEVSGISAVQVFFATIAGVWAYRGTGYLHRKLILYMGSSILIGSFIGAFASNFFPESSVNIVYAILATIAVVMMFLPKKPVSEKPAEQISFHRGLASALSFIVGIASGIVGAAGSFLLVPIMLTVLKLPTRVTIATSLAVTFISSIGSTIGKVATDQVLYGPAIVMIIASVIASPIGAKLGQKMNTRILQWILALIILGTSIQIWFALLRS